MKRVKVDESKYTYVCTWCNYQLPIKNDTQKSVSIDDDKKQDDE